MVNSYKPRVLIVHNYYQIPGGEDTVVANEKKLLEDNGHEVILYSRNNSELKGLKKIQKLFLPFITIFSLRTYIEVKKVIRKKKIDIVHVHNTLNLISPSVYYAAYSCEVPIVQTIHNFRLLCPGATFYRDGGTCEDCVNKGLKFALKHKCYRGSFVHTLACVIILKLYRMLGTYKKLNCICLTEFNKEKLLSLNQGIRWIINPDKVFIKPNFVDIKKKCIPYEKRKNQFIFAGRIDTLKGVHLLLEAWKQIDFADLIICGTGPEEDWINNYVTENQIKNVHMMGLIPNAETLDMIAESKALILPTQWYEGFPMTIVESFACGTPVIGSNIGNVENLLQNVDTGHTFRYDAVDSLVDTVKQFKGEDLNPRKLYELLYNSETNYELLMEIYKYCR
jgi:glycosyltransferase involved in cell wall biosynthesis